MSKKNAQPKSFEARKWYFSVYYHPAVNIKLIISGCYYNIFLKNDLETFSVTKL
jgi:hypothetical protein